MKQKINRALALVFTGILAYVMLYQPFPYTVEFIFAMLAFFIGFFAGLVTATNRTVEFKDHLVGYVFNGSTVTAKFKEQKVCHYCGTETGDIFYANKHGSIRAFCPQCVTTLLNGLNVVEYDEKQRRIG